MNYSFETFSSFDPWAPAPDEVQEEIDDFSEEDLQLLQKTGFTVKFIQEVLRSKFQINTFDYFLFMSTVITHQGLAGQLGPQKYHANMAQCRRFVCFGALQKLTISGSPLEIKSDTFTTWYPHLRVLLTTSRQEQVEFMAKLHAQYLQVQSQQVPTASPQSTPNASAYSGSTVNQQNLTPGTGSVNQNTEVTNPPRSTGSQTQYTFEPVTTPQAPQVAPTVPTPRVAFPDTVPIPTSRQQRGGSLSPISQYTNPVPTQELPNTSLPLHTPQVRPAPTISAPLNEEAIPYAFLPQRTNPTFGQVPAQSHPPNPQLLHPAQVPSSEGLGGDISTSTYRFCCFS